MLAATIREGEIVVEEHADPEPGVGQVLVAIRAAGLNAADLLQMHGGYPAPPGAPQDIPGLEIAGEVAGVGPGATRFNQGDRVMGLVGGGGQAQLAVVHERVLMPVPDTLAWPEAGGFPEVFTTAHDALFTQAGLRAGERLLVHGAAGGVGCAGVQLGRTAGARVTATVRDPDLRERVSKLGASRVLAPGEYTDQGPYDVILELVGAPNVTGNLRSLATGGRIVVIGTGGGATAEINLGLLMARRGRIHGSTLRVRPLEEKALTARGVERSVLPFLAAGAVAVPIAATFPLAEAAAAYERFAAGGKFGKIVLTM